MQETETRRGGRLLTRALVIFNCSLPLTSSSSTVVFESEDSLTWDSSPFLAIIDLPGGRTVGRLVGWLVT